MRASSPSAAEPKPDVGPPERHPRATRPSILLVTVALSVLGAIIGMQILTTLGITPNTSLIGVLLAVAISRAPTGAARTFRSVHVQNLVQTNISSATFGAANSLLLPIGLPVLIGRPDLVPAMLAGATLGMLIDVTMLYWFFDSRLFPGAAPWPHGIAAAEAILAGDQGGARAALLGAGAAAGAIGAAGAVGLVGAAAGGAPMSAFGVAFIGNAWALGMFAAGLLVAAWSPPAVGIDLNALFIPHGVMIGAGLVALAQALAFVARGREGASRKGRSPAPTRSERDVRRAFAGGFVMYALAAALLAAFGGLSSDMSAARLVAWVVFAAFACIAAELIVGFSAMHAGWFPAFATALIFLVLGLAAGFPPVSTALLVGLVASGGPAFADAGYDFKAGYHLRGGGRDRAFELDGRRQQLIAGVIGLLTALVMVAAFHDRYFARDLFSPIDRVYAATIRSGVDASIVRNLILWAIPGVLIQLAGGPDRQMGVLLATGLLVANGAAGWAVLAGLAIRAALVRRSGAALEGPMGVFGAGCIAGDAVWSFAASIVQIL